MNRQSPFLCKRFTPNQDMCPNNDQLDLHILRVCWESILSCESKKITENLPPDIINRAYKVCSACSGYERGKNYFETHPDCR